MTKEEEIKILLEEAQANLTLWVTNKDEYALERYNRIMEHVRQIQTSNSKQ